MKSEMPVLYLVATAHLDTVWNWDLEQTVKKYIPDTLEQNFALIEKYPEYKFNFEGAYRYRLIKEYYPEKYDTLKKYIKAGRWCPVGSALENGDVNIPSPEALIRNFLYGNRFFAEEFGLRSNDIFLPDCFGFSHALPAVGAHMGLKFFSTAKLVWCGDNYRPFDLGKWYGADGSYLIACLDPCAYISDIGENYENSEYMSKKISDLPVKKYMRYYGVGDMGGAPKEESVQNVCRGIKNSGRLSFVSGSPCEFADSFTEEELSRLPEYNGELVMKTHGVGAYTSRGIAKRLNRKNEIIADTAERFSILADRLGVKAYPYEKLTEAWKRVICHQFHDDITGTATDKVYENTINEYFVSLNEFSGELSSACEALCDNISTECGTDGTPIVLFNSCAFARKEVAEVSVKGLSLESGGFYVTDDRGNAVLSQLSSSDEADLQKVFIYADVPAFGYKTYYIVKKASAAEVSGAVSVSDCHIENQLYKAEFNNEKNISQIYNKISGRKLLSRPICFEILHNSYSDYGAWEILYSDICSAPEVLKNSAEIETVESGPLRNTLKITRRYRNSTFVQFVTLDYGSDKIVTDYIVDWKETASLLKLRVSADEKYSSAVYEGGIGVEAERNNHEKKYEFAANRWVALKEEGADKSILLMSDCKYGWDKPTDNVLRMTALHTPYDKRSDAARHDLQDFCENRFGMTLSLASDKDFYKISDEYNYPITAVQTDRHNGNMQREFSFAAVDNPSVTVRAMKRAEESSDIILRLYNTVGTENICNFTLPPNTEYIYAADGNEIEKERIYADGAILTLSFKAYETKTVGLRVRAETGGAGRNYRGLELPYNTLISSSNSSAGSYGFGSENKTLPSELMSDSICCRGITFALNKNESGDVKAVLCEGQELSLPPGTKTVYIAGGCLTDDKNTYFTVAGKPCAVNMKNMFEPIGRWDQYAIVRRGKVKNDALAFYASHTHGIKGDYVLEKANLFLYKIEIPDGAESLVLPFDRDILIVSAVAGDSSVSSVLNKILYDTK